jgi:benzoylformate decarboxylase
VTLATTRSAAVAMFETLRAWGVDRVFICPGSTEAAFLDASLEHPDVELVTTTHEAITVSMADGYARITGRPAIAYVHTHLGLANTLAHLSCTALGHSPVVVVTGLKASSLHGAASGFTTTSDVSALPRQFVKWAHESATTESIAADLGHALRTASAAPAGPVFLGIAQDRMEADARGDLAAAVPGPAAGAVRPAPEVVTAAAGLLASAHRPLVVAGSEPFRAGAEAVAALDAFAAALGAPVVVEDRRTIEQADPGALTGYAGVLDGRAEALGEADLVVLAGARTPIRFEHTAPPLLPPGVPVLHVSADPVDLARGPAGGLAVLGDVRHALRDLTAALGDRRADGAFRDRAVTAHHDRVGRLRSLADEQAGDVPIRVPALMRRLCATLRPASWVVDDSVTSKPALLDHALAHDAGLRYLTTAGGSLGWGVGAALGVAEALPGERITAVVGDGVAQFGLPGLWTAVDRRLAVTFVVVNNEGYGAVRAALRRFDGRAVAEDRYPGTGLPGVDMAAVARGFGAVGVRVERLADLDGALAQAAAAHGPAVVEVVTDPDDSGPLR